MKKQKSTDLYMLLAKTIEKSLVLLFERDLHFLNIQQRLCKVLKCCMHNLETLIYHKLHQLHKNPNYVKSVQTCSFSEWLQMRVLNKNWEKFTE